MNLQYKENNTNFDLYDYGYNIFQIYEIIDSIDADDIKTAIERQLENDVLFQKNIKTQTIMKKIKQMRNDNIVISSPGTP